MQLTKDTRVADLTKQYPWLIDEVVKMNDKFKVLKTPVGKMLMKKATIADASAKSGLSVETIIAKIEELVRDHC